MYDASADQRQAARDLYWQGFSVAEIERRLKVPYGTIDSWKRRDKWDDASADRRVEVHAEAWLCRIMAKADKTPGDLAEIDAARKIMESMARIRQYGQSGREGDLNPAIDNRAKGRRRKAELKNTLTEEQVQALRDDFERGLFGYQRVWLAAKSYRVRNILKSRQIGATWYFAREALMDAVETGDNQIFLSASKAQAHVFREYIVQWVQDVTGVTLKGDPITLWNGSTLYFLGTNSKTAQSYHGHVYMDEYAWISRFGEFRKVASAMATHKKWRITYFSTPSTIGHQAHAFWAGDSFNRGRAKADRVEFDVTHQALQHGLAGADGQWRHIVTIEDAAAQGCDLFDIAALRREYNDADFANLFLAQWVDDTAGFFLFDELRRCMVDSWEEWHDFTPHAARPYGDLPVWIGYDPASSGDNASIVVVAPPPPGSNSGTYRVLEKIFVNGMDFPAQAARIESLCERYNVVHMGIDSTTIGKGVFQLVRQFYPAAREIVYSVDVKTALVLKAKQLISKGRLAFDAGWSDVAMAFMSIRRAATAGGGQPTFKAGRTKETGHADIAWAIMHALDRLDFQDFAEDAGTTPTARENIMEIF